MTSEDTLISALRLGILSLVAVGAAGVVRTREPLSQALALGFYGLLLTVMFFSFQAPDVALSQLVVGAVVSPLMILLTLSRIRRAAPPSKRGTVS
jgi:uncharacterized MnhB-related membrane protein